MHDRLYTHQDRLSPADLVAHASALGLDVPRFTRDLGSGRFARHVRHDSESAEASGIVDIPAFFVGGRLYAGVHDARTLATALLAASGVSDTNALAGLLPEDAPAEQVTAPAWDLDALLDTLPTDLPETPDSGGDHPRLTDGQLDRFTAFGEQRPVSRGDILYRPGDEGYDFHIVLEGAIAVVGRAEGRETLARVHGPRRFLGALDLFDRTTVQRAAVVVRDGSVLRLTVEHLRELLNSDDELRELVQRAFLIRHAVGIEHGSEMCIVGHVSSPRTRRIRAWADAHDRSSVLIDVDGGEASDAYLIRLGLVEADLPVAICAGRVVLRDPDEEQLRAAFEAL